MSGGSWDDDADTFEAITLAAASEAFDEYEARERAARAPTNSMAAQALPGANPLPIPLPIPKKDVGAWLAFARGADYFTMLGLPRDAGDAAIVRARDLALAALAGVEPSLADRARAVVQEAAAVLGDAATRAAYARHLSGPSENPAAIFWLPGPRRGL